METSRNGTPSSMNTNLIDEKNFNVINSVLQLWPLSFTCVTEKQAKWVLQKVIPKGCKASLSSLLQKFLDKLLCAFIECQPCPFTLLDAGNYNEQSRQKILNPSWAYTWTGCGAGEGPGEGANEGQVINKRNNNVVWVLYAVGKNEAG